MTGFWAGLRQVVAGEEIVALKKEITTLKRQLEGAETLKDEAMGAAEAWQYEAEKVKEAYSKAQQEQWRLSQEWDEWSIKCASLEQENQKLAQKCHQLEARLKAQIEAIRQSAEVEAGELGAGQAEETAETEEERKMRKLMGTRLCEQWDLPVRIETVLRKQLFNERWPEATAGDLCQYRMSELLKLRGFGALSANQLNYKLREAGLSLAAENSEMMQAKIDKILRPSQAYFVKLADLDLSAPTYAALTDKGYETVADVIVCRISDTVWSEEQVREEFVSQQEANEFLKKIAAFGFVLD